MNYYLFVDPVKIHLIQVTLNDYPIPGVDVIGMKDCQLLPNYLLLTTDVFTDLEIKKEISSFFKSIGYTGKFKILKPVTYSENLVDFELVPPY